MFILRNQPLQLWRTSSEQKLFITVASGNCGMTSSKIIMKELIFGSVSEPVILSVNYLTGIFHGFDCSFLKPSKQTFLLTFVSQNLFWRKDYRLFEHLIPENTLWSKRKKLMETVNPPFPLFQIHRPYKSLSFLNFKNF